MHSKEEKLRSVFDESYGALVYFASKILSSTSEAEDVVQDAFIKYWNQFESVSDNQAAVKSYLYTAVRNACLNLLRHHNVSERYSSSLPKKELFERDALDLMLEAETAAIVFKAIETLPPVCRKITQMSYLEGKKNDEIAYELGISVNSVKTQKQRGLQLLRKKLSVTALSWLIAFV